MAVDRTVKTLCDEANLFDIYISNRGVKGIIHFRNKEIHINPAFWNERVETFVHEMLHYYHDVIKSNNLGKDEEFIIENCMKIYMKNEDNKKYVEEYLRDKDINYRVG